MTARTFATGIAVAALLVTTGTATAAPSSEEQVLSLTNGERAAAGCPALTADARLDSAAKRHNDEMARTGNFSHTGVDGSTPAQRVTEAGYTYRVTAENIAMGQGTAEEVVSSWMASEGHRANILNCDLRDLGVAFATDAGGRTYWTQEFGLHQ
ncbi:CAP domain-containing protein [Saccharothrix longispora]|uniref:CAP domain-containing protein n=1 Tax=Saccharothrix longispora TaxID=33920 RepID=UPI0028FD77EB|nr:CAP domain-containing protein [Saccharothrix longispora]MDU0290872.1 CAP domain-containing protein [Saccharothrix longispora]